MTKLEANKPDDAERAADIICKTMNGGIPQEYLWVNDNIPRKDGVRDWFADIIRRVCKVNLPKLSWPKEWSAQRGPFIVVSPDKLNKFDWAVGYDISDGRGNIFPTPKICLLSESEAIFLRALLNAARDAQQKGGE